MLRVISCIVFVLSANCLPLQSQEQERRAVSLRIGFSPDGPFRTYPFPEGIESTFFSRRDGRFRFTPIIGEDSEVVVTVSDSEGTLMGEVTLPQTDDCQVIRPMTAK